MQSTARKNVQRIRTDDPLATTRARLSAARAAVPAAEAELARTLAALDDARTERATAEREAERLSRDAAEAQASLRERRAAARLAGEPPPTDPGKGTNEPAHAQRVAVEALDGEIAELEARAAQGNEDIRDARSALRAAETAHDLAGRQRAYDAVRALVDGELKALLLRALAFERVRGVAEGSGPPQPHREHFGLSARRENGILGASPRGMVLLEIPFVLTEAESDALRRAVLGDPNDAGDDSPAAA